MLLVDAFLQDVELFVFERHLVDKRLKDNPPHTYQYHAIIYISLQVGPASFIAQMMGVYTFNMLNVYRSTDKDNDRYNSLLHIYSEIEN